MDRILRFKLEVKKLCQKYNVSISHEDIQGAFIIKNGYDVEYMDWFMSALDENDEP